MLHRQTEFLQRRRRRIDHVRVAAQLGNVAVRMRAEVGQYVLQVATPIGGTRHGAGLTAEAAMEQEAGMASNSSPEEQFGFVARAVQQRQFTVSLGQQFLELRQHHAIWGDADAHGEQYRRERKNIFSHKLSVVHSSGNASSKSTKKCRDGAIDTTFMLGAFDSSDW